MLELFIHANAEREKEEMLGFQKAISESFVEVQNQSSIKWERINLHDFIEKAIEILRIQIKNACIKNCVSADVTLMANSAYMESIILNRRTNIIKYKHPARDPIIEFSSILK